MTISTPTPTPEVTDTAGDKLANARKAIAAGVAAAFAAGIPLFGKAILDGVVTADEAGTTAAAFVGALVSVAYVTWQTVNKPKPTDVLALQEAVAAVPPIVIATAVDPAAVEYVGLPDLPVDPATSTDVVVDKPGPDHRAE
jgi:hypothetical protein